MAAQSELACMQAGLTRLLLLLLLRMHRTTAGADHDAARLAAQRPSSQRCGIAAPVDTGMKGPDTSEPRKTNSQIVGRRRAHDGKLWDQRGLQPATRPAGLSSSAQHCRAAASGVVLVGGIG